MALSPLHSTTARVIETTARVDKSRESVVYEPVDGARYADRDGRELNYPRVQPTQKSDISSENKDRAERAEQRIANASGFRSAHALRQYLHAHDSSESPSSSGAYEQGSYLDTFA